MSLLKVNQLTWLVVRWDIKWMTNVEGHLRWDRHMFNMQTDEAPHSAGHQTRKFHSVRQATLLIFLQNKFPAIHLIKPIKSIQWRKNLCSWSRWQDLIFWAVDCVEIEWLSWWIFEGIQVGVLSWGQHSQYLSDAEKKIHFPKIARASGLAEV